MSRSRSSFDLDGALAAVRSITEAPHAEAAAPEMPHPFAGVDLVSFQREVVAATSAEEERGPETKSATEVTPPTADLGGEVPRARKSSPPAEQTPPPKLPDLSGVVSPIVRCEKIVQWIAEATGSSDVFLADADGLPLAGAIHQAEARLAGSGNVASSVVGLASALPGNASPLFELHVGEGPFFQLIGFQAGTALYVVGLSRRTPLTPRQAHAVRLACRHALGPTLQGE
jgi:hypothetical protein